MIRVTLNPNAPAAIGVTQDTANAQVGVTYDGGEVADRGLSLASGSGDSVRRHAIRSTGDDAGRGSLTPLPWNVCPGHMGEVF